MATIPTIHLNGTSGDDLKREYHNAYKAIDAAIDALGAATSNGRDFYPQGSDAYSRHRQERNSAFSQLFAAQKHVEAILIGVCDQLDVLASLSR